MAVVSRATFATDLATRINANTAGEITDADVRAVFTDLEDSVVWNDEAAGIAQAQIAAAVGTSVQAFDADLTAIAALSWGNNEVPLFNGSWQKFTVTGYARSVLVATTPAQARAALNADSAGFPPENHTHAIADVTGLQTALDGKINSNVSGISGASAITNIVSVTQAEYDALATKNPATLYIIEDA